MNEIPESARVLMAHGDQMRSGALRAAAVLAVLLACGVAMWWSA